jgi:Xaa-Pro dipeptidase
VLGAPNPVVAAMAQASRGALESMLADMRPGASFAAAAARAKPIIRSAGPEMIFHGTYAYSIGLGFPGTSWSDAPVEVRDGEVGTFEPGMVLHLPMSLRLAGKYGVAFSETVAITASGCEVLGDMTRDLFIV